MRNCGCIERIQDGMRQKYYPDAEDLSIDRDANIIPETVDTLHNSERIDAERGAEIMEDEDNAETD